jgi:lipopolysaccharide/colanic/teichoic acid biosynthesis glycosyltransferase
VSTQAMERQTDRSRDVDQAAERLALRLKRSGDVILALLMLVALVPVLLAVVLLLAFGSDGWTEQRRRLGRDGRTVVLSRFAALPGGAFGRVLERLGARELPLLFAVLWGRLSFVGPRALEPEASVRELAPRQLMAPGLTGPAQRAAALDQSAALALDDAYVLQWSLWMDAQLLAGRCPRLAHQSVSKSGS